MSHGPNFYFYLWFHCMGRMGQVVVSNLTQRDITYVTFINNIYPIDKSTV